MSFANRLKRLRDAVENPPPGFANGKTVVYRRDLADLLHHFERLDNEARERHYVENREQYATREGD